MTDELWSTPDGKRTALRLVLAHLEDDEPAYIELLGRLWSGDPIVRDSAIRWLSGMVVRSYAPDDGPLEERPIRQKLAGMIRDELSQLEPPPPDFWRRG